MIRSPEAPRASAPAAVQPGATLQVKCLQSFKNVMNLGRVGALQSGGAVARMSTREGTRRSEVPRREPPPPVHERTRAERDLSEEGRETSARERRAQGALADDPGDSMSRHLAQLGLAGAPPLPVALAQQVPAPAACEAPAGSARSLPELLELEIGRVVRRLSVGGDARRGSARVETSAGTTISVSVDGAVVHLSSDGDRDLAQRVASRLRARGYDVTAD